MWTSAACDLASQPSHRNGGEKMVAEAEVNASQVARYVIVEKATPDRASHRQAHAATWKGKNGGVAPLVFLYSWPFQRPSGARGGGGPFNLVKSLCFGLLTTLADADFASKPFFDM